MLSSRSTILRRMLGATAVLLAVILASCSSSTAPAGPPSVSPLPGRTEQLPTGFPVPGHGSLESAKENPNGGVQLRYRNVDQAAVTAYLDSFRRAGWHKTTVSDDSTGATYELSKGTAQVLAGWTRASQVLTVDYRA